MRFFLSQGCITMLEDIALTGAFFAPAKYARKTFQFKTKLLTSNSALSTVCFFRTLSYQFTKILIQM